jgi:hypothetical protein
VPVGPRGAVIASVEDPGDRSSPHWRTVDAETI